MPVCYLVVWLTVLCMIPVHGMENNESKKQKITLSTEELNELALTRLCEHSHHVGFQYSEPLRALQSTSRFFYKKIKDTNNIRKNTLQKAVEDQFLNTGKYGSETLCFNKLGNACGFKQKFCTKCLSPEWCACVGTDAVYAALYRVELNGDCNSEVARNSSMNGWEWKSKISLQIHKTCIESLILEDIINAHLSFVKCNVQKPDWESLYIPEKNERAQWNHCKRTSAYEGLCITMPFFNKNGLLQLMSPILSNVLWICGAHTHCATFFLRWEMI
jgi:hypothetical protein